MGLLGGAAGLLNASGPSRTPVGLGQALGQGLMGGIAGYNQGQEAAMMNAFKNSQMSEMQRKTEEAKKRAAAIESFAATLPEAEKTAFMAAPDIFLKEKFAGYNLKPGEARFVGGSQVAAQPELPKLVDVPVPGQAGVSQPTWLRPGEVSGATVGGQKLPEILNPQVQEARAAVAQKAGEKPYFQFLPTPGGYVAGNARTGTVGPVSLNGNPVIQAQSDPALQGSLAAARAGGKEMGEAQAAAQINLPQTVAKAEQSLNLIDQMIGSQDGKTKPHPGFTSAVGATMFPGARFIPGSDTSNFMALMDQVKGGQFLQAFEGLKGGGQITEIEGKKATDAISRMSTAQSESEFVKAAREYQEVVRAGVQRTQQRAAAPTAPMQSPKKNVKWGDL